ncbi:TorF family putative porin [Rudaea cellulosilytica]|uniref:TorF family putative porin n=1 Tax=Rudaea cellulosilytica TaxID=540746 RepID=UPI0003657F96|nr:TorF family putative porin [Rudaea cellulosilytica]
MNKKYTFAILAFAATAAHAQSDASQETPPYTVTGNVAVTSDYMFRGLTQTWGGPAVQGGFDLALANGFAAGTWASSVSDKTYPGAALELDLYASYGTQINDDWSWRVGLYGYVYPHGNLDDAGLRSRSFNTLEANAALAYKWLTLKYSHALTDYFGIDTEQGYRGDSKGASYVQLDAAIPLNTEWSLALHAGHTRIGTRLAVPYANGADDPDYSDYGASVKYQFSTHWNASLGATYASNKAFYGTTSSFRDATDTRDVGGTRGFAQLQGTF